MAKKNILMFQPASGTIRLVPGNYMIARHDGCSWVNDPDLACDPDLATVVFRVLLNYDAKYGTGDYVMQCITLALNTKKSVVISERSVELFFGRACACDKSSEDLSRTIDEVVYEGAPVCLYCETPYQLVSTLLHTGEKNLSDLINKY